MAEFSHYSEAINECRQQIVADVGLPELRAVLLEHADAFVEERHTGGPGWGSTQEQPSGRSAGVVKAWDPSAFTGGRRKYFVIRNDHLKPFAAASGIGQAVLGYATTKAPNVVTFTVGLLVAVVTMAAALLRKGISLGEDDFRILMLLKQFGPQTADDLSAMLNGIRGEGPSSLSPDDVKKHLERLRTIGTPDGKYDSLVVLTDGRWDQNGL